MKYIILKAFSESRDQMYMMTPEMFENYVIV